MAMTYHAFKSGTPPLVEELSQQVAKAFHGSVQPAADMPPGVVRITLGNNYSLLMGFAAAQGVNQSTIYLKGEDTISDFEVIGMGKDPINWDGTKGKPDNNSTANVIKNIGQRISLTPR